MYKELQIIIENEFISLDAENLDSKPTVFDRAFRKLIQEKNNIGKLFPVFIKIKEKYYILGIFTLNRLGSTSLFLELPEGTFFDHITFGKSLIPNKTHLTEITDNERKKVTALDPAHLSNKTYHVLTLLINDLNLLKLVPRKIIYPPVDIEHIDLVRDAIMTRGGYNGSGICEVLGEEGVIVVQLFLIPKGVSAESLNATKFGNRRNVIFDERKFKNITLHKVSLGHEFQNEYQFGLVSYRYNAQIDETLYLEYSTANNGAYFNTDDIELSKSVIKAYKKSSLKKPSRVRP